MKYIISFYLIVGFLVSPFIYSNNALSYRSGSTARKIGEALGSSLYWPSYVFSIEPEINGDSVEDFEKSVLDMIEYRDEKLFTGKRSQENRILILSAIGNCGIAEGFTTEGASDGIFNLLLDADSNSPEREKLRSSVINRLDDLDFSDLVEEGEKCEVEWKTNKSLSLISKSLENQEDIKNINPDGNPDKVSLKVHEKNDDASLPSENSLSQGFVETKEHKEEWDKIKSNPQGFINECISGMRNGNEINADQDIEKEKEYCSSQLADLHKCMLEKSNANICFYENLYRGD